MPDMLMGDGSWPFGARVLVVGDVMLDRYLMGQAIRISPEAPVPVVRIEEEDVRPGGAANVAANVAALGGRSHLLSVTGDDAAQRDLLATVAKYGVVIDFVADPTTRTTEKTRIVSGSQQITRVDREANISDEARAKLKRRFMEIAGDFDIIVLSDYAKGVLHDASEFLEYARILGKPTLVDPKRTELEAYRGAHVLKPNQKEFEALFGQAETTADIAARARCAMGRYGINNLVVTRGPLGMILLPQDGPEVEVPTFAQEVFDVSGAGDSVISMLAVALGSKNDLLSAVKLANVAAGVAVSRVGTYVVTAADMMHHAAGAAGHLSKVVTLKTLPAHLRRERLAGKKVVFTNGCFDILHPGHVRLLSDARKHGDLLVVGLNSDASVRGLKGDKRPVNTFADRAEVLAALDCVDFVVEFDAPTPIDLIKAVMPDVLIKGGDYEISSIVGSEFVTGHGGKVYALPFHDGYSTTGILTKSSVAGKGD